MRMPVSSTLMLSSAFPEIRKTTAESNICATGQRATLNWYDVFLFLMFMPCLVSV